jgi:hypothetical protein
MAVWSITLQGGREIFQNDDGDSARILELMLQLPWGVKRVDVHAGVPGAQNRRHGHGKLGQVGQHDGHPAAGRQTLVLQPRA